MLCYVRSAKSHGNFDRKLDFPISLSTWWPHDGSAAILRLVLRQKLTNPNLVFISKPRLSNSSPLHCSRCSWFSSVNEIWISQVDTSQHDHGRRTDTAAPGLSQQQQRDSGAAAVPPWHRPQHHQQAGGHCQGGGGEDGFTVITVWCGVNTWSQTHG